MEKSKPKRTFQFSLGWLFLALGISAGVFYYVKLFISDFVSPPGYTKIEFDTNEPTVICRCLATIDSDGFLNPMLDYYAMGNYLTSDPRTGKMVFADLTTCLWNVRWEKAEEYALLAFTSDKGWVMWKFSKEQITREHQWGSFPTHTIHIKHLTPVVVSDELLTRSKIQYKSIVESGLMEYLLERPETTGTK